MQIFLSYSSKDEEVVKVLAQCFQAARKEVWSDSDLRGGDVWWDKILENIRSSSVFVFALSDASGHSRPCLDELDYAKRLGLPVLPVQVGPVTNPHINPLADRQIILFRPDDALSGFEIAAAIDERAQQLKPLPDPLPAPPPIPYGYLQALKLQIDSTELDPAAQTKALDQLRHAIVEETEKSVREDILAMLRNLMSKPWIAKRTEMEARIIINTVLMQDVPESTGEPSKITSPAAESDEEPEDTTGKDHESVSEPLQSPADQQRDHKPPQRPPETKIGNDLPWTLIPPLTPERDGRAIFLEQISEIQERRQTEQHPEWRAGSTGQDQQSTAFGSWKPSLGTPAEQTRGSAAAPVWPGATTPLTPSSPATSPATTQPARGQPPQPTGSTQALSQTPAPAIAPKPHAYWAVSAIATCSIVFGAIALYFSYQVGARYEAGNLAGARKASNLALAWGIVGIVVGLMIIIVAY